jgi:hypothetical protein
MGSSGDPQETYPNPQTPVSLGENGVFSREPEGPSGAPEQVDSGRRGTRTTSNSPGKIDVLPKSGGEMGATFDESEFSEVALLWSRLDFEQRCELIKMLRVMVDH